MKEDHILQIAQSLNLSPRQVAATALLLADGATIPFIARYRKERTGSLNEVQIAQIRDELDRLQQLDSRRQAILQSLSERNLLTPELKEKILAAPSLASLEDLYQPFRPKRKTRASIARERGLEPLADLLWLQNPARCPTADATPFINPELEIPDADTALAGARDILAERIADCPTARAQLRQLFLEKSTLRSKVLEGKQAQAAKYRDYFDWSEPAATAPSHRILAIRRGEAEGFLLCRITPPEDDALAILRNLFLKNQSPSAHHVNLAIEDSYRRLLCLSLEGEARAYFKQKADQEAIRIFADNLRELLLAPPLGQKTVLAIDPGFRTGCKIAILNPQGALLAHDVIYPDRSAHDRSQAEHILRHAILRFQVQAIAVGNGTASRETEAFLRSLNLPHSIPIVVVNEAGASVYSTSDAAREEFPDLDATVRGAISIGRRLMDPLAELVKIDPKSIGVGQYQHDVDQAALQRALDDTVTSCVNLVGVELNTASRHLLTYVSGLNARTAAAIVAYRDSNGPFRSRTDLLKVPGIGPKTFEQAAGFLRIRNGSHPLDASAVHPERYPLVEQIARDLGTSLQNLLLDPSLRSKINPQRYVTDEVGLPTLNDILAELAKPGRDPRQQFDLFSFSNQVHSIADLKPGMRLPGIVTNVTAFGAFVNIGVHQDGLVHISQLADHFVKNPTDVVKPGQRVTVTVLEVDLERNRISLSLRSNPSPSPNSTTPSSKPKTKSSKNKPNSPPDQPLDWFTLALNRKP